jgi:hypothetical protein
MDELWIDHSEAVNDAMQYIIEAGTATRTYENHELIEQQTNAERVVHKHQYNQAVQDGLVCSNPADPSTVCSMKTQCMFGIICKRYQKTCNPQGEIPGHVWRPSFAINTNFNPHSLCVLCFEQHRQQSLEK